MNIIVDTNILFSACISPNNKIAEILFSPLPEINRISCYYTIAEMFKHQPKILKLSKLAEDQTTALFYEIIKQIDFINESIIEDKFWIEADRLTSGVDSNDIAFVALTLQKDGILWTGDKHLTSHLKSLDFNQIISTQELYKKLDFENPEQLS
ncbi:MAG: PIN domain-containing protein [Dyadobacter sp.]